MMASACGKVILFGEHAAVYGRPALAVPISAVRAYARVYAGIPAAGTRIWATDLGQVCRLEARTDPLALAVHMILRHLHLSQPPALEIIIHSDLPVARGLGSGAAVSTALVRAIAGFFQQALSPAEISELVFEVEKVHHGTPSGVDNTVIAYEQPVYFLRGQPPTTLRPGRSCTLLVADTGVASSTREVVSAVRQAREVEPARYEALFDTVRRVTEAGRADLEAGDLPALGTHMNENHAILQQIGVSSPALDRLVAAARHAGALGAKLCGAGRGGNMVALARHEELASVITALQGAGAAGILTTELDGPAAQGSL